MAALHPHIIIIDAYLKGNIRTSPEAIKLLTQFTFSSEPIHTLVNGTITGLHTSWTFAAPLLQPDLNPPLQTQALGECETDDGN
jgi:hypothetical protein